ncbi:hypothetical protein [Lacisediminimonas sp.]|uniref:hypothetical protein n=1 Tax=Lacisediminimonas sp. TaxID=3060582 RepID=UPI00271B9F82|nr:hypothetical protein [Lacisediminimonas sp.]MDO8299660.1 hypothetical protein [Lacisediminimonas sp.]MDO9218970.1 hypothetical protein [Lacisediminimonas sp.]
MSSFANASSFAASFLPAQSSEPSLTVERLPFTIRAVHSESDLLKAVRIRHSAYMRHVPGLAESLSEPEAMDHENGVVVMLAESRLDGSPLGTMRVQTNAYRPLTLERSVSLPEDLANSSLAEATRLGVTADRVGRMVKTALFKAFFMYCQQQNIEWMVIAGRSPIDRMYDRLLFADVYPEMGYIPLAHAGNMPHRIMSFEVGTARQRWEEAGHSLFDFVFMTNHPDIDVTVPARQDFHHTIAAPAVRREEGVEELMLQ